MKVLTFLLTVLIAASIQAQPLHVIWDRSGAGDSSRYGYAILPLGDQNNDGFNDWAVFALGGQGDVSVLEFFHGGNPLPTQPHTTEHFPNFDSSGAFRDMGVAGDVNGDGYRDWYILRLGPAPYTYNVAEIYFGGPDADTLADWAITVPDDGGWFGSLGDFNGDGYDDVFCYHNNPGDYVDVYYGGSPMDTVPDWTVHSAPPHSQEAAPQMSGDLNGDGYSDYVAWRGLNSTTYVFLGGVHPDTLPAYTWPNMPNFPRGIVKDLNGDGCDELLYTYVGGADVHLGGPVLHSTPDVILSFPCVGGATAVASAGDFNRDGFNDLLMWTDYCADADYGFLTLHLGHPWIYSEPTFAIEGWTPPLNLIGIWTAAGLGDVNGDHVDDIAIGALDEVAYLGWRGRVIIIAGDSTLRADANTARPEMPQRLQVSVYPNPFNGETRISFALQRAGEVTMQVYDVVGRLAATLLRVRMEAGEHGVLFDGKGLASGIYFVRVQAGKNVRTEKLMLLR